MNGKCIIVSAGSFIPMDINYNEGDFLIACDGGYAHLSKMGILPDLIIGDFDSLSQMPGQYMEELREIARNAPERVMKLSVMKDDTDTLKAVRVGLEKGYDKFYLYGALGGSRLDHTFANVQTLLFIKHHGAKGYIMDASSMLLVAENETIRFNPGMTGMLSVFCLGEKAKGVSIKGTLFEMDNGVIDNDFPIGVSNEFIIDEKASVTVEEGTLLICVQWDDV
ncbi:MAG: thiamine diphosphokinase [Butyrivibrio sp.]|nr:thiamine diphosphokinase [Butyrivibrio sp.]